MASPKPAKQLLPTQSSRSARSSFDAKIPALLILLTVVVMCPLLTGEFTTWDDLRAIERNAWLNPPTLAHMEDFWNPRHPFMDIWVPLTYTVWSAVAAVSYIPAADPQTGSHLNSWIFHGTNLTIHLTSVLVMYAILRRLCGNKWAAAAGAALFAIHPVEVEPVGWLAGMKDVLSGCLSLIAVWQYLLYADGSVGSALRTAFSNDQQTVRTADPTQDPRSGATTGPPLRLDYGGPHQSNARRVHYFVATLAFALSMLAKPSGVVTPLIVAALDWLLLGRPVKRTFLALLPWVLLTIPVIIEGRTSQAPMDLSVPIAERPLIAGDALAFYLYKLVWPLHLGIDYDRTPQKVLAEHWAYYTCLICALVAAVVLLLGKRYRWLIAAAAVFCLALLPELGFVPFDFQAFSTVADHYLYLAMLGPALAAAMALRNVKSRAVWTTVATVLLLFSARAFAQTFVWHDSMSLYRDAVAVSPRACVVYNNLGETYRFDGDIPDAVSTFETGLRYDPDCLSLRISYANALKDGGRFDEAERQYQIALKTADPRATAYIEQNLQDLNAQRQRQRR